MGISVKLFWDFKEIQKIEDLWNQQIVFVSKNPLIHSSFFSRFMSDCEQNGSLPSVLTFWSDEQLVGMAPLKVCKFLKLTRVCSLDDWLYSDFVFLDEFREQCMDLLLDTVFNDLNCISAEITIDNNSPNFELFKTKCLSHNKLTLTEKPSFARAIIPLDRDYSSYYKSLNRTSRKHFRRLKRKIEEFGSWTVSCVSVTDDSIKKVFEVDKKSWKSRWRKNRNIKEDTLLRIILEASEANKETAQKYESEIWFLHINGVPAAYQIVLIYGGTAYFIKTSYDENFKQFSPGVFLINDMIREFYPKGLSKIDFMSNLPFVQSWKPTTEKRTKLIVRKKSTFFSLIRFLLKKTSKFRENISLLNN